MLLYCLHGQLFLLTCCVGNMKSKRHNQCRCHNHFAHYEESGRTGLLILILKTNLTNGGRPSAKKLLPINFHRRKHIQITINKYVYIFQKNEVKGGATAILEICLSA